jgi:malonyl-CoA O-methyltransferase
LARINQRMQCAPQAPWLHGEVGRRMAQRLPIIRLQPARVLDWWSSTGGSADALRQAYPQSELLRLEPAPNPAEAPTPATTGLAPWWSMQRWRGPKTAPLTEPDLQPGGVQLVWANMGLHRWADPQTAFQRWQRALAVDGFLMFSTLGPGSLAELRAIYASAGWPPPFAPFVDMHDLGDMLVAAGFADPVMDQELLTLTWPDAQAALNELRQLGGNAHPARAQGLRTRRWRAALLDALAQRARPDGRVALTFEVVYGHAFKPVPRVRVAPTSLVPVEDLRRMARGARPKA